MDITALMLADSRFPGGGHAHSGGIEEAAARGLLRTEDELPGFLLGRLRTAGELAAVFAAAAAHAARRGAAPEFWAELDAELDARTPSAAQREASRAQGAGTRRALRATQNAIYDKRQPTGSWVDIYDKCEPSGLKPGDGPGFDKPGDGSGFDLTEAGTKKVNSYDKCESSGPGVDIYDKCVLGVRPHHAVVVGVAVGLGGGLPVDAALTVAYLSVSGPASAAVRLLGLDPFAVNAAVLALSDELRAVAERAAAVAMFDPADLPAPGAPGLDLLAEAHKRKHDKEVRLFAS